MNPDITHYAGIYHRYKDQFDSISPETVVELHNRVRSEFYLIPCEIKFVAEELNDYELLKHKLEKDGILYVSTLHNESRLFPGDLNLAFRAVHDLYHLQNNLQFTYEGERRTWFLQSEGMSYQSKQVMFSEIVMQAAYFTYYRSLPLKQKVILIDF